MNFDGRDDDRAGKQKQCSAENLPIFLASFVKVSIFLIILSRHHLLRRLSALHHGFLRLYKVSFGFSYIYNQGAFTNNVDKTKVGRWYWECKRYADFSLYIKANECLHKCQPGLSTKWSKKA